MRHYVLNIYPTVFFPRDTPRNLTLQASVPDRKVLGGAKNSPEYTQKTGNKSIEQNCSTLATDVNDRC